MSARRAKSKKRSAASSTPPEPEPVLFVDECLGRHAVPAALRQAGATVERHCDHFQSGLADEEWLKVVGAKGWVVLTKDKHIRRRPLEVEAFVAAGVRVFVLTGADMTGAEQAEVLSAALPRVRRLCRKPGPFIARVTRLGEVALIPVAKLRR